MRAALLRLALTLTYLADGLLLVAVIVTAVLR